MSKKIKIGIVGTGGMANSHAEAFKKLSNVELTSCLDVVPGRAEAFAKKHGFKNAVNNLDDLLCSVDAVSVVTPDRFHAAPSLATLRAGKHLLCEKPLTVTLAESRQVATAAQKAAAKGVIHMVNFSYRRSAAFQKAIKVVAAGKLGGLRHVHSFYFQSWLSANMWGNWTNEALLWRVQKASGSGGVLGDVGCHILDLTTGVAGEVARIRCELRTFAKLSPDGKMINTWKGQKLDANDSAVIEIEFTNGALGVVQTTRWASGHVNSLRLEAHGTQGALMFDLDRDYNKLDLCIGADKEKAAWKTETLKATPGNIERFVTAIRRGQPDQPDIVRGAQVQAYLDACERSAQSGRWEKVSRWL